MVLEIKVPHGEDWDSLKPIIPILISYVLSFLFIGVYWVNHHHFMHTVQRVNGSILWANMHLLFWLSIVPVATDWMGESHFAKVPVAVYAALLLCCGIAYTILEYYVKKKNKPSEKLMHALRSAHRKSIFSIVCYLAALAFAFVNTTVSGILFLVVSIIWFIPDKNIERALSDE